MITLRDRDIDRLLPSLFGCALFLTVLWLWRLSYTGSCGALVLPAVIWCAIFHGLLQYQLQRRRFVVEFHLEEASGLRKWFGRPSLVVTRSLLAATPLAAFLVVHLALSDSSDWFFLCTVAIAVPLLFAAAVRWPGSHFRHDAHDGEPGSSLSSFGAAGAGVWPGLSALPAGSGGVRAVPRSAAKGVRAPVSSARGFDTTRRGRPQARQGPRCPSGYGEQSGPVRATRRGSGVHPARSSP